MYQNVMWTGAKECVVSLDYAAHCNLALEQSVAPIIAVMRLKIIQLWRKKEA